MASLFLARRCQASLQSEAPWSSASSSGSAISLGKVSGGMLLQFQFWIQPDLHDVHGQIEENDQRRVKQDCTQHERVIAIERGGDEKPSQTRNVKDRLHDKRAGDDAGGGGAEKRNHRRDA